MTDDIADDIFDRSIANFRRAIRNAALEEAAKAVDELLANRPMTERGRLIGVECAIAIRALKAGGG